MAVTRVQVPPQDASLEAIFHFATTTFFGYDRLGVEGLGAAASATAEEWKVHGRLPATPDALRSALFFEARRWHHFGRPPDEESEQYIRGLAEQLRLSTGGEVRPDREGLLIWLRRLRNRLRRRGSRTDPHR